MFLLVLPRRRRWGVFFALLLSVAVVSATGCGSNVATVGNGGGGGGSTSIPSGTYNVTITATSGNLVHSAVLVLTVQ